MKRSIGLETEYGISIKHEDGFGPQTEAATALFKIFKLHNSRVWLHNGALLYNDLQVYPEYATGEVASPLDLVAASRAGDAIVHAAGQLASGPSKILLYKANCNTTGTLSFGSHENYLHARRHSHSDLAPILCSHLATRAVWAGAGAVHEEPFPHYELTGRAPHTQDALSGNSTAVSGKPMLQRKDEPHAPTKQYQRLHIIAADANVFQFPLWLRFASTIAVLDYIEEKGADSADHVHLANSAAAYKALSLAGPNANIRLANGSICTALEHQYMIYELASSYLDETTAAEWLGVLEDLDTDPKLCSDRVEWVAKHLYLEKALLKYGTDWSDPRVQYAAIEWSNIDPCVGTARRLEALGSVKTVVSTEQVVTAIKQGSPDTRAHQRGRAVKWADSAAMALHVDWATAQMIVPARNPMQISLADPFTPSPELEKIIAHPPHNPGGEHRVPVALYEQLESLAIDSVLAQ